MNASLALHNNILGIYHLADIRLEQSYYWLCYPKYDKKLTRLNKQEEDRSFWIYTWEHYRFQSITVDFTSNVNTVLMTESETRFISMIQNLKKAWPPLLRSGSLPVQQYLIKYRPSSMPNINPNFGVEKPITFFFFFGGGIFFCPQPLAPLLYETPIILGWDF